MYGNISSSKGFWENTKLKNITIVKTTLRTTQVKPYNVNYKQFKSTQPIMYHVSKRYMIRFCYTITANYYDSFLESCSQRRRKGVNNLINRGVVCIVSPSDAKVHLIYGTRFNNLGSTEVFQKSIFVVKSFSDRSHNYMTYAPTSQCVSKTLILFFAPYLKDLIMFLRDITKAITQSQNILR